MWIRVCPVWKDFMLNKALAINAILTIVGIVLLFILKSFAKDVFRDLERIKINNVRNALRGVTCASLLILAPLVKLVQS